MITISLLGVDKYLAPELVKKIHQKIANLYLVRTISGEPGKAL